MRRFTTALLFVTLLAVSCIRPVALTPTPAAPITLTPAPVPPLPPTGNAGFPWWNETVFYEIFVRSFYDSNGDGIGDLNGLIEKLDYLNDGDAQTHDDLGITGLWLMPIHPSPSYHGYDVTDYYAVNPDYGTTADFQRLMQEAHKRGIRVIIDLVMNHTSNQHPWFVQAQDPQSPYHDWYRWAENNPGGTGPWGQQVWYQAPSGSYYYAVFAEDKPDLNYAHPAVREEMKNVARFWLAEMGVDGFRVDGARYIVEEETGGKKVLADSEGNHAWYREFRTFYKTVNPNAVTVGEVWTSNDAVAPYLQGDELDLAFNFDLASAMLASGHSGEADAFRISQALSLKLLPKDATATFLTNHDQNRLFTELGDDVNKAKRAATLLLTGAGTPFLYYGEEIGLAGQKPDEDLRLPMQWSNAANAGFTTGTPWRAPNADYTHKNVASQLANTNSPLAHYRVLIDVRQTYPALRVGETFKVKSSNRAVFAYLRVHNDEVLLVVNNLRDEGVDDYPLTIERGPLTPGQMYTIMPVWGNGPFAGFTADANGGVKGYQPTSGLAPGQTLILQLQ